MAIKHYKKILNFIKINSLEKGGQVFLELDQIVLINKNDKNDVIVLTCDDKYLTGCRNNGKKHKVHYCGNSKYIYSSFLALLYHLKLDPLSC